MPNGVFRNVVLLGNLAFKFPRVRHLADGMRCNRWEREMWTHWWPIFQWRTLCPVLFADPLGFVVVMPRALQPVSRDHIDALPDYYPGITAELKPEDYGCLNGQVVALDYGIFAEDAVLERRGYYEQHTHRPASEV